MLWKTRSLAFTRELVVDLRDVRMIQRGEDLGFSLKPGDMFRIIGEDVRQNF